MRCHSNHDDTGRTPTTSSASYSVVATKRLIEALLPKTEVLLFLGRGNQRKREKTVSRKKLGRLAHQANFLDEWLPFFHQLSQNMMIATKLQAAITKQHNSIKTSLLLFLLSSFSKVGNGGFLVDFYIVLSFFNADQNDVFCDSQKTRPSVFLVKTRLRITKGSEQEW